MTHFASEGDVKVAIVIVTYNAPEFVRICLESVRHYSTMPYEIIVVDNGSEEPLRDYLRQQKDITLILNQDNQLWSGGSNTGMQAAHSGATHFILLNSDIEVRRADWLQRMVNLAESDVRIGMVGNAHARTRVWPTFGSPDGQCLLIKRSLTEKIGLLDSVRYPWNGADIDFAARAFKAGYIYKILPRQPEIVVHYRGMSRRRKKVAQVEKEILRARDRSGDIIRAAGLRVWHMPRWLWEIYSHVPGRPFYKPTKRQRKLVGAKIV